MQRYERTDEGVRVHDLQVEVMKTIDVLYAENKVQSKEDKPVLEQALSRVVHGDSRGNPANSQGCYCQIEGNSIGFL